jgi:hypothetical protein
MIVATLEMIQVPSMSACIDGGGETLTSTPRPLNREFAMRQVRGMFAATAVLFVLACLTALVTSFFAAERETFVAEAKVLGSARVVAKSSSYVTYEFRGERHQFEATGKQQNRWPMGAGVAVWSYEGRMVAEPEMPGMPRAGAMFLSLLPVAIGAVIFFVAMQERQLRRRLWCHGVEVAATLVSDHIANNQREVVYRYAAHGLRGVARQAFGASRRPLPTTNGWHVVVLASGKESRLVLADEV